MDNSVRQFQPFRRHLALQGAIFLIWHPRNYFQTMRRVTHVFFVSAVLGYCHDFPAGVAVRTLGAARQKSLCKIDQSQKRPLENSKGTGGNGKGSTALTVLLGFQNQTDEMRSPTEGATAAIFVSRSTTERRSTRARLRPGPSKIKQILFVPLGLGPGGRKHGLLCVLPEPFPFYRHGTLHVDGIPLHGRSPWRVAVWSRLLSLDEAAN
jgi:hypothetical protein